MFLDKKCPYCDKDMKIKHFIQNRPCNHCGNKHNVRFNKLIFIVLFTTLFVLSTIIKELLPYSKTISFFICFFILLIPHIALIILSLSPEKIEE